MAGVMLGWIALFPKVAMGPYGVMDAAQRRMFFGAIMETQPARSPGDFIRFLLPGLVAMLYLGWRAAYGGRQTWLWGYATACAAVALLLGMKFVLFVEFSAGLAAGLLPVMLADISARLKAIPAAAAAARLALIFVFLLATRTPLLHKAKAEALPPSPSCDLLHIGPMLAPFAGKVVLADVSATPELLYRTGILTVGSLYQHGVPGFLRARAAWRSVPGAKAPPELAAAQARLILFCPAPGRYALVADLPPDTLWDALDHNRIPGWLKLRAEDGAIRLGIIPASLMPAAYDGRNIFPPVIGCGTPVVPGKESGRPYRLRTARKPKHCASSALPSQPTASTGSTGTAKAFASPAMIERFWRPPPQTSTREGAAGMGAPAMAATVKAVSVAAPSAAERSRLLPR